MDQLEDDKVTIDKKDFIQFIMDANKLYALEAGGVDNWEGYDDAMEAMRDGN